VVVLVGSLSLSLMWAVSTASMDDDESFLARQRNFFGVLYVIRRDANSSNKSRVVMVHGNTTHGTQFESAVLREKPTLYYSHESGVGLAIENLPCYVEAKRPIKLGVVGLGAGTLCCYARPGDFVRFYEIDPLVVEMSQKYFTYQSDAKRRGAHVDVVLGDARIVMERELAQHQPQQYDILVIDAFSSDAVPLHLLTRECFQVYREHLRADGLLAVHVSNRHLDLRPAVKSMADHFGYHAILVQHLPDIGVPGGTFDSTGSVWIILTRNEEFVASPMIREASQPWPQNMPSVMLTDDASSLLQLLNW